jgi:serine protease
MPRSSLRAACANWCTLALLCACLAACGGGGGGGSSASDSPQPEPPLPPPVFEAFTLSGTISTSSSQTVDSDTNDPLQPTISNNTRSSAQSIANPITLGGYVNQPGSGAEGQSQLGGDVEDYFRVELLEGQRITMVVADFNVADADLYLWSAEDETVVFSIGTGEVEFVDVPADGTYLVNVFAFGGATNYTLAIGAPNTTLAYSDQNHEIVPWEAIVNYTAEAEANNAAPADLGASRRWGLQHRAGGAGRSRLMAMRRSLLLGQPPSQSLANAATKGINITDASQRARWETLMMIKSLRKDPSVRSAYPNYRVFTQAIPNDQGLQYQWHYPLINLPEAWDTTVGSADVLVAVIDTGILFNHPDLAGQLVSGYDFVRNPDEALDGDGIDPDPSDPGSSFGGGSESFHGTHVSGTVAARSDNIQGVAGSAFGARVMPLRALGAGGTGTSYDIGQAVRFAAGLPNDSGAVPDAPADIINLSLGGAPFDQSRQNLYNEVKAAGVIVVAAAGNNASRMPLYPASYNNVISVSAVDAQRRLAVYSNYGAAVDVSAPGGDRGVDLNGDGFPDGILSTSGEIRPDNSLNYVYSFLDGTSFAAPHVSGVLALMKSVNPDLTPADIDNLLASGALTDDLGPAGRDDDYGHGLINAQRAVLAAVEASGSSPANNPILVASATTLNFGGSTSSLTLNLNNVGGGSLQLQALTTSEAWLQVSAIDADTAGLGTYSVTVDRTLLTAGIYSADIVAQSSVNTLTVRVLVSEGLGESGTGLGVIYVLLLEVGEATPVAQFVATSSNSLYPFEFRDIPAGDYEILAGTDTDNDFLICDAGDACGALLTIDQPVQLTLDQNTSGLDFPVEYLVSLPSLSGNGSGSGGKSTEVKRLQ